MKKIIVSGVLFISFYFISSTLFAGTLPMPPVFKLESDQVSVLKDYPLGVIDELAAFSHHGQPDHKIKLPNGNTGWVYEIYDKKINEYLEYDGTKTQIIENRQYIPHRSFTLVFDSSTKVVDVLFDGRSFKYGLSSIQVKRRVNPQAQKLPNYDHGVHFAPGQTVNN